MPLCAALTLLCAMPDAAPQLVLPPGDERPLSRLAPLDPASVWHSRFAGVAEMMQPVLARGAAAEAMQFFGDRWLGAADRDRIVATLLDREGAFAQTFAAGAAVESALLGWQPPEGAAAYAAFADRPEGDAILCWRAKDSSTQWPSTAAEAEDRQAHACVRVSYSVRFETPQWHAFMDAPPG